MVHTRPNMTANSLKTDSQMNTSKRQRSSGQLHTQLYVAYKKFTLNIKIYIYERKIYKANTHYYKTEIFILISIKQNREEKQSCQGSRRVIFDDKSLLFMQTFKN